MLGGTLEAASSDYRKKSLKPHFSIIYFPTDQQKGIGATTKNTKNEAQNSVGHALWRTITKHVSSA